MYGIQKYGKILNVPETPEKSAKKHYHRLLNTIFFTSIIHLNIP